MRTMKRGLLFLLIAVFTLGIAVFAVACGDTVTLSFETDGGTEVQSVTLKKGEDFTLPESEKDGFIFGGWFTREDPDTFLTGTVKVPEKDTTYYAYWAERQTLTLNAGDFGTLTSNTVYLKAGDNVYDAVKDIAPTVDSRYAGVEFGSWFNGDMELSRSLTMPRGSLTLTARYTVGYTTQYFLQDLDQQNYTVSPEYQKEGRAYIDETVTAENLTITGFRRNDSATGSRTSFTLTATASVNILRCYYDRSSYVVHYFANLPADAPADAYAEGTMEDTRFLFGIEEEVPDCAFAIRGYRFIGWSKSENGGVDYYAGEGTLANENASLYAVWEKGLTDALGGGDFLFCPAREPGVVYVRRGNEERKGSYDAATGVFTIPDGASGELLYGKISGEFFYYYKETLESKTYESFSGNGASFTVGHHGAATYKDSKGTSYEGYFEYNTEHNFYVFYDNTGKEICCFRFENDEEGNLLFREQDPELAGYYATASGYPVIYLDGLGGLSYYFDPEHPDYVDFYTNVPILEAQGSYEEKGDFFEASTWVTDYTLEEAFAFRLAEGNPPAVGDFEIKGLFERSDFYGYLVLNERGDGYTDELRLDGFGSGEYFGQPGTYEQLLEWWLTTDGQNASTGFLVRFDYGTDDYLYYGIQEDRNGNFSADLFGTIAKDATIGGYYPFEGEFIVDGTAWNGFIFVMEGENSMVWVDYDEGSLSTGEVVTIYACYYMGSVAENGKGGYLFTDSETGSKLNFKIEDGKAFHDTGDPIDNVYITDDLYVNPNIGKAYYKNKEVRYTFKLGYIEYYSFEISATETLYYIRADGWEDFVQIAAEDILDYNYYNESLANGFMARLLIREDENGNLTAYLATPMADNTYSFLGWGEVTPVEGTTDEFTFRLTEQAADILDYFGGEGYESALNSYLDCYGEFRFKKVPSENGGVGSFYTRIENMAYDCENFTADGYSNRAVYRRGGEEIQGTFEMLANIIVFTSDSGNEVYYLKASSQTSGSVMEVSSEAGMYYFFDSEDVYFQTFGPDYNGYTSFIVLGGDILTDASGAQTPGTATIYDFESGLNLDLREATYVRTESYSETFREYLITERGTNAKLPYTVLLGEYETTWHDIFPIYDIKSDALEGTYSVVGGGSMHGDGYRTHDAEYTDAEGNKYYGLMARVEFDRTNITDHGYVENANGQVIVFTTEVDGEAISFVFDLNTSGRLEQRLLRFGAYALWDAGERPGSYMYLDGHGTATLYNERSELIGSGTYREAPEIGEDPFTYVFTDANGANNFEFALFIEQTVSENYFEYRIRNSDVEGTYKKSDWSSLTIGFYGEIVYTDRYGNVYEGYYRTDDNRTVTLYTYDGTGTVISFRIDGETFEVI